jgi:hypothetical protein
MAAALTLALGLCVTFLQLLPWSRLMGVGPKIIEPTPPIGPLSKNYKFCEIRANASDIVVKYIHCVGGLKMAQDHFGFFLLDDLLEDFCVLSTSS